MMVERVLVVRYELFCAGVYDVVCDVACCGVCVGKFDDVNGGEINGKVN